MLSNKYLLIMLLPFQGWVTVHAQDNFSIQGKFSGPDQVRKIYLMREKWGVYVRDSILTANNRFSFRGNVMEPERAVLTTTGGDFQTVYLDKGSLKLEGASLKISEVTGGASQKEFNQLNDSMIDIDQKVGANILLISKGTAADKELLKERVLENDKLRDQAIKIREDFINTHPDSYVSLDLLLEKSTPIFDPANFERQFNNLTTKVKSSARGIVLYEKVAKSSELTVGKVAPDITQHTAEGKAISLSSLKGTYVLIDFWASWCGGCRALTPDYIKTYAAFKDKNFEILAVSLDSSKERWLNAIKEDGGNWIQVSDLKGNDNSAKKAYGIGVVPQNFLVDPNGIIIARNIIREELNAKLREVLK